MNRPLPKDKLLIFLCRNALPDCLPSLLPTCLAMSLSDIESVYYDYLISCNRKAPFTLDLSKITSNGGVLSFTWA